MDKLELIGFYTLSDDRAKFASASSDLQRVEIIITDRCNFSCPYCRGLRDDCKGEMTRDFLLHVINECTRDNLLNIRFSGGEPTLHPDLVSAVKFSKVKGVKRIAVSTNGSASKDAYLELIKAGVNDFSVSLDACCASEGKKMNGGVAEMWAKTVANIKFLSSRVYTTVGMVFNEGNVSDSLDSIKFASSLGVADIRVISSAQYNQAIKNLSNVDNSLLLKHPILRYRVNRFRNGVAMRGIKGSSFPECPLMLDDMVIAGKYHFPCVIHMREGGKPIGEFSDISRVRQDRWGKTFHFTDERDEICQHNCLDVCVDYNNKWREFHKLER